LSGEEEEEEEGEEEEQEEEDWWLLDQVATLSHLVKIPYSHSPEVVASFLLYDYDYWHGMRQ
jgi:hypothetical protein